MHKGFLLIDKPTGITSFDVVRIVKKIFGVKRVGHSGTLDPLATGLLLIAVGEGTKLLEFFIGVDKEYEVVAKFGYRSDTYDADGKIEEIDSSVSKTKNEILKIICENFLGEIQQIPPKYSALKIKGKKAYELARQNQEFELKAREVKISSFEILDFEWPLVRFGVVCSSGTYIRSLINDLGEKLGCGAYVQELRRIQIGQFSVEQALSLEKIKASIQLNNFLVPLEKIVRNFPHLDLTNVELESLKISGQILGKKIDQGFVAAFYENTLVGILEKTKTGVKFRKRIF